MFHKSPDSNRRMYIYFLLLGLFFLSGFGLMSWYAMDLFTVWYSGETELATGEPAQAIKNSTLLIGIKVVVLKLALLAVCFAEVLLR